MTHKEGLDFLLSWSASMMQKLSVFSREQLSALASQNDGGITTGVLAGVNDNGTTWTQAVTVRYSADTGLTVPTSYDLEAKKQMDYFTMGKGEIAREFVDDNSARAKIENTEWAQMRKEMSFRAFSEFEAKRLVDLTIQLAPNRSAVGGPIDEVALDAHGVRWIALKPDCPAGTAKRPDR